MTAPPRPDPALLAEIGLLRRRIAALEDDAGSDPSPERRLEADRVRQSIAVLRGIMRNLLIGFAVVNPRGEIVDANDAFARLLGYTRKELLDARLTWKQITPPGFEAADRKARETLRSTGAPYTYRKEYLRRDDSRVQVTLCVLYTTDLRDDHALFVLDDSARRKSELDQEQAERIYRSVLDAIPDLVVLADPAAQVVWANRAFLAFYGVTLPEITGRFGPASWPPAVLETVLRDRALVLETGMTLDRSLQERTRSDGQTRVLHVMTAPILDAAGRVVRTVSIARDVTERARDDAALLRSEAHLRTAQALARAGSYECDVPYRGNDIWSEQMYEILGLPREGPPRPLMECIEELTHPDDLVRAREAVLRALAEGGRLDVVFRNRLPDGTTRLIRSIGEVVHGPDGLQKRIVGTLLDVTAEQERRSAQAERQASPRRSGDGDQTGDGQAGRAQELQGGRRMVTARPADEHDAKGLRCRRARLCSNRRLRQGDLSARRRGQPPPHHAPCRGQRAHHQALGQTSVGATGCFQRTQGRIEMRQIGQPLRRRDPPCRRSLRQQQGHGPERPPPFLVAEAIRRHRRQQRTRQLDKATQLLDPGPCQRVHLARVEA